MRVKPQLGAKERKFVAVTSSAGEGCSLLVVSSKQGGWSIGFREAGKLAEGFASVLYGWDLETQVSSADYPADVVISRQGRRFDWKSSTHPPPVMWSRQSPASNFEAVCDLVDVLFDWHLERNVNQLCLHAAAVEVNGSVVCFPSVQHAGKSTLSVELARRGHRFICDDVLPIVANQSVVVSLGISPRLRLPLPSDGDDDECLHRFVQARRGPSSRSWAYVNLRPGERAVRDKRYGVTAFVLLRRDASKADAILTKISRSEMLKEIVLQNFARRLGARDRLDALIELVARAETYCLRYGSCVRAADVLERSFPCR